MKKMWKMMMTAGVALLLAACGTTGEMMIRKQEVTMETKGL